MGADAQVLILDATWQPVNRVPMPKAVRLLLKGRAEVVEADDAAIWKPTKGDKRTATEQFRRPSVVRLVKHVASRSKSVKFSRQNIWLRDKGRCQYCGVKCSISDFTYDHVTPASRGGVRRWENIVCACVPCNQKKGGRTPEEAGMRLLSKPVKPRSLAGAATASIRWTPGMPERWRAWVRDTLYWNDELES